MILVLTLHSENVIVRMAFLCFMQSVICVESLLTYNILQSDVIFELMDELKDFYYCQ